MLTTKEKQEKLLEALNLKAGDVIILDTGRGTYTYRIKYDKITNYCLEILSPLYKGSSPLSRLITHNWKILGSTRTTLDIDFSKAYQGGLTSIDHSYDNQFMKFISELSFFTNDKKALKIDSVYYNTDKKTTVVNWSNGETTKVKCAPEDKFDLENGIMAAIAKYHCENKSKALRNTIARAAKKAKDTTKKEN